MRFAIMSPYSGTGNYAGAARGRTWCGSRWRNWWTNFSPSPVSFILGQVCGLPSNTQGRSRVRESCSLGSVRGDRGNSVPYRDRPGDTLVVWRLSRLARSLKQIIETAHELEQKQALKVLTRNIDTGTPEGRLFFHITAAFDEFQRELYQAPEFLTRR